MPAENLNHLQQNINNKDLRGMKDMRIKYFGENKENGTGRVAVIRFTDEEFELYEYIAKYEKAYGDDSREFFNGHIIAVERDENGVTINEAYIDVEDFDDYNEFKANYKEAKKEFNSLKKQATETESETATDQETSETEETADTEVGEFVYDVGIHNFYECRTFTVRADNLESAEYKALKRMKNGKDDKEYYSIDFIRIHKENSDELLKEKSELNSKFGVLAVEKFHQLTKTLIKSLFKAIGTDETRKIPFIISNNMVFFNYNGIQYKYYPSQSKIFRKRGKKYQRINWKDFAEENNPDGQKQFSGRSPPFTPDIRSSTINDLK